MFAWLPREQLCVLVYLVSVMHSMQAGYMEKAQKYTDKALLQIDKLKGKMTFVCSLCQRKYGFVCKVSGLGYIFLFMVILWFTEVLPVLCHLFVLFTDFVY